MMSVAAISAMAMAQSVTTHSMYDVNQSGEIDVVDATKVVDNVVKNVAPEQTQQYVTGEELSTMFSTILAVCTPSLPVGPEVHRFCKRANSPQNDGEWCAERPQEGSNRSQFGV